MRITVIGGGISGLTISYRLARRGHEVVLVERDSEPGGLARGMDLGGYRLDRYYRHIFRTDEPILSLIREMGLEETLLWLPSQIGFYCDGKIYPFGTPVDLLRFSPLQLLDRIRFGLGVLYLSKRTDWKDLDVYSAKEWIVRWMGKSTYEVMWAPLLRLKFGDACEDVSAAWVWGRIHPRARSRSKGMKTEELGYMKGSFAVLMDVLAERTKSSGAEVRLGEEAREIRSLGEKWCVETDQETFSSDLVVCAVPNESFLQMAKELPEAYRVQMENIDYQAVTCLALELEKGLSDIYWLNVVDPDIRFAGVIEHTNFVPPSHYGGKHVVYLFQYLPADHPDFALDVQTTFQSYLPSLQKMFPHLSEGDILSMTLSKDRYATPVYARGYVSKKPTIQTPLPGIFLANTTQIYPEDRNMSNGVALAEEVAIRVEDYIRKDGAS